MRICYVNPTVLCRRPISELLGRQGGSLLIARKAGHSVNTALHHVKLKDITVYSYGVLQLPIAYEWPIPLLRFWLQAWRVLRKHDIVHVWGYFYLSTWILVFLSMFTRTKVVLSADTLPGYSFSLGWMDILFKIYNWTLARPLFWRVNAITLYGKALCEPAKKMGLPHNKIRVIATGVEPLKARDKIAVRKRLKLSGKIVLYAGLVNPRKRVDLVLEVARRMSNTTFLIAGEGPSLLTLKKTAPQNVKFLGWRQDIPDLLYASDALFFPSSAEGLPGIVMEAMCAQLPVVTSRIACITDLIVDKKSGMLCDVGDVECLYEKLSVLLEDKKLAKSVAVMAKKTIREQYSWDVVLPKYQILYKELLSSKTL